MSSQTFGLISVDSSERISEIFKIPVLFESTKYFQARFLDTTTTLTRSNEEYGAEIATWGWNERGRTEFTISMKSILKKRPWNVRIHNSRGIVPVNGILIKDRFGNPFVLRSVDHRMVGAGVLINRLKGDKFQFTILTTEAPNTFKDRFPEVPVLMSPDSVKRWLKTKNLQHIMHGMDQVHRLWLDLIPLDKKILGAGNEKDWLNPVGPSLYERNRRLRSEQEDRIEKDRPKRGK